MTSAALATMTCKRLSSLISLARALATPSNASRFRAWRSLSTAVIEIEGIEFAGFCDRVTRTGLNTAAEGQVYSSWKNRRPISDVGAPQHLRRAFIQLIGAPDFFK